MNIEILLPENAPVRLACAQLEELDYRKLYEAYSSRGRKSAADPRVMFQIMAYGYQCGIYSSRKLEEACRYRVDFIWLRGNEPVPDHSTFARFRTGRCTEAVEDLFYQYVRLLEKLGETDHQAVFVDGTKLESRAGRYTFCWRKKRGKTAYQGEAAGLWTDRPETAQQPEKATGKTKSGDRLCPSSGHRKSEAQKHWETLDALRQRWENYEQSLEIMGTDRNSYSKTDPDATFMRMKEDHMRNGQLKPGYNVQIAVNSEYITGIEVFSDRTDYRTLGKFMNVLSRNHRKKYAKLVADAGYESLQNYLYLEKRRIQCYIKPQNHDQRKTAKFRRQIGRMENMTYLPEEDSYLCAQGRKLSMYRESEKDGVVISHYRCGDCKGCTCRAACCGEKRSGEAQGTADQEAALGKTCGGRSEYYNGRRRLPSFVPVHSGGGAFGLLKNDFGFRRFLTAGKASVRTELLFLALAFNLKKCWMKRENGRMKTHLSRRKNA